MFKFELDQRYDIYEYVKGASTYALSVLLIFFNVIINFIFLTTLITVE